MIRKKHAPFPKIGEMKQKEAVLVGMAEDDLEHALLRLVEIEQAGEQRRPHF
jgi:hypothetical protein